MTQSIERSQCLSHACLLLCLTVLAIAVVLGTADINLLIYALLHSLLFLYVYFSHPFLPYNALKLLFILPSGVFALVLLPVYNITCFLRSYVDLGAIADVWLTTMIIALYHRTIVSRRRTKRPIKTLSNMLSWYCRAFHWLDLLTVLPQVLAYCMCIYQLLESTLPLPSVRIAGYWVAVFLTSLLFAKGYQYSDISYDYNNVPSLEHSIVIVVCPLGERGAMQIAASRAMCHLIVYQFERSASYFSMTAVLQEWRMRRLIAQMPRTKAHPKGVLYPWRSLIGLLRYRYNYRNCIR